MNFLPPGGILEVRRSLVLDALFDRMVAFLNRHHRCVLSVNGLPGAWAMPVRYRLATAVARRALAVECLLPCWADGLYYLERNPHVMLVVRDTPASELRWLQMQGRAQLLPHPDWHEWRLPNSRAATPGDLYRVVRVVLHRLDLVDEGRGWGVRETLELDGGGKRRDVRRPDLVTTPIFRGTANGSLE